MEPGELYDLFVEPNPVTVKSGTIQEFALSGLDVEENTVSVSPTAAKWSTTGGIGVFEKPAAFLGTKMGRGKVTATVGDDVAEAYVTVIPGEPDPANSSILVTYPTLPADGSTFSELIIDVRDSHGNPVPEAHVILVSSRQADKMVQPPATSQQGLARGRISSKKAGSSVVRAIVDGATFPDTAEVTFK